MVSVDPAWHPEDDPGVPELSAQSASATARRSVSTRHEEVGELGATLRLLADGKWWIISLTLLSFIVFALAAFLITPVYRASVLLVPTSSERGGGALGSALGSSLGGLGALAGINLKSGDMETEEALAVLRSRQFTQTFIVERNLEPQLFPSKWDAQRNTWKVPPDEQPTEAQAYKRFDKKVRTIQTDKKTGLITLAIDWTDRAEAADWANDLVKRLNDEMRRRAISTAQASREYLERELAETTDVGTREAIYRLIESQIKNRMLANVTQEYVFRVVDKALAPDKRDPVWPMKVLFLTGGPLLGLILGILVVLIRGAVRSMKRPADS